MPHKPYDKKPLGRFEFRFKVPRNTIGVLYQGAQFVRLLEPDQGPQSGERLRSKGLVVYIVDVSTHQVAKKMDLLSRLNEDTFPFTIKLEYKISDPLRMVQDRVEDVESLIFDGLDQLLRKETRLFQLNQHDEAENRIEEILQLLDWNRLFGIELASHKQPDVIFHRDPHIRKRIEELDEKERTLRTPRTTQQIEDVPSKEPAYRFRVMADITYRVINIGDLTHASIDEVVPQLWPRIRRELRRYSRKYSLIEVAVADMDMQDAVDDLLDRGIANFGLRIEDIVINTDIEPTAQNRYLELAEIQHKSALEDAKVEGMKDRAKFYDEQIKAGSWAVLAISISNGEVSYEDVYKRLNDHEKERLQMQLDLVENLRKDNIRDEQREWEVVGRVLDNVADEMSGQQVITTPQIEKKDDDEGAT